MKRLGIIQPGRIGDIIICLPIAKHYSELGYDVYWPVSKEIIFNFEKTVKSFVKFIPIEKIDVSQARNVLIQLECNHIIDISFCIKNSSSFLTNYYKKDNKTLSFDQFKYEIAGVPFDKKWELEDCLNFSAINEIRINESEYFIYQKKSSDKTVDISIGEKYFEIKQFQGVTVFDWISTLKKAKEIHLVESCFSNIVDQLKLREEGNFLYLKKDYYGDKLEDGTFRGIPRLKSNWTIR